MAKLNQIIAIEKGKKTQAKEKLTEAYQLIKKADIMVGITRTYQPKDEDGETQPNECKNVQVTVDHLIEKVYEPLVEMFDTVATQDWANCEAHASVLVRGKSILSNVPVTHLLFLEKQLVDIKTFVEAWPVLDPAERWEFDPGSDCYASKPSQTNRTKKVMRSHVAVPATPEHPAQVQVYQEDVPVGTWTVTKFSGAIRASDKNEMVVRINELIYSVKAAREEANCITANPMKTGKAILDFIFGDR